MHHLARHSAACFLTRGDLWQSWEAGAAVFEERLLDADPALNAGNWMWLSCSAFFYQYFRCYSPVAFAKKWDPEGAYVKRWLPQLRGFSAKHVYEPWLAPIADQRAAGCIVGVDYPKPIVDHARASKENMAKMASAYEANKAGDGGGAAAGGTAAGGTAAGGKVVGGKGAGSKAAGGKQTGGKRALTQQTLPRQKKQQA